MSGLLPSFFSCLVPTAGTLSPGSSTAGRVARGRSYRPLWRAAETSSLGSAASCLVESSGTSSPGSSTSPVMSGGKQAVPRVLSELQKAQVAHVAGTLYGLTLNVANRRQDLADALAARMRLAESCDNVACDGAGCDPGIHIFQPVQYLLPAKGSTPIDRLLAEHQDDEPVQVIQESETDDELNPPPDAGLQRQNLRDRAAAMLAEAAAAGVTAEDLFAPPAQGDSVSGTSSTATSVPATPTTTGRFGAWGRSLVSSLKSASMVGSPSPAGPLGPARSAPPARHPARNSLFRQDPPRTGIEGAPPQPRFPPPPAPSQAARTQPQSQQAVHPRPEEQQAAAGLPSGAPDLASALAGVLDMLRHKELEAATERTQERYLRDQQLQNAKQMAELLDRKLGTDGAVAGEPGASKGRVALVPPPNPVALAQTGCAVAPQYALLGDTSSLDLSSARNKIKSGRNSGLTQDARVAESWPNQFLDPMLTDSGPGLSHDKLSLVQWAGGFVTKIFAEIDVSRNGAKEHNQLNILMRMLRVADIYPWGEIIKINESLFSALERGSLSWTDMPLLDAWWSRAMDALRLRMARPALQQKRPLPGGGTAAGGAEPPAKKDRLKDIGGVPGSFLRTNNICIKWNVGSCSAPSAPHDCPDKSVTTQVKHICGGCAYLAKGEDSSHSMKSCRFKNKEGLFR